MHFSWNIVGNWYHWHACTRILIWSTPQLYQACIQARGRHTNYWILLWVAALKFWPNGLAIIFFHYEFQGVFEFSPLQVGDFHFHQTLRPVHQHRYQCVLFFNMCICYSILCIMFPLFRKCPAEWTELRLICHQIYSEYRKYYRSLSNIIFLT